MYKIFKYLIIIFFLILLFACKSSSPVKSDKPGNLAYLYNPGTASLHPKFNVYHLSPVESEVTVRLFLSELMFSQANPEGELISKVGLNYELINITDGRHELTDTASFIFFIERKADSNIYLTSFKINASYPNEYELKIYVEDLFRKRSAVDFIEVDKSSTQSRQNFKINSGANNTLKFTNYLIKNEIFTITFANNTYDKIYIDYYINEQPLPRPVFSLEAEVKTNQSPDSSWVYKYNESMIFSLSYQGMYHFRFDTAQHEGLSLYYFGEHFPGFKSPGSMIKPLAYLTSTVEYNQLLNERNKKLALDKFWKNTAGNVQVARELIRIYYNRATFANIFFSSDRQGWMTDRGMIYIIYGPPAMMRKTGNEEKWEYFRKPGARTLEFTFRKRKNAFTENDFELARGETSYTHWREAVNSWRNGRVYHVE